jgi:putative chitinase
MINLTMMEHLWPNGNDRIPGLREAIVQAAPTIFAKYGIDTDLVIAHFMAQISHECGAGLEVVENLNYSAHRLMQVWPSRFPTWNSAVPYAHNPQALADNVYNGRMGNRAGTNDGYFFRGRGATQTTGRAGYNLLGNTINLPLTANPDLVNDRLNFLEAGVADFILCGCLPSAEDDNVRAVTFHLNGGLIGLAEREQWLVSWKHALGVTMQAVAEAEPTMMGRKAAVSDYTPSTDQLVSMVKWAVTLLCGYAISKGWINDSIVPLAVGAAVSVVTLIIGIWQHTTSSKLKAVANLNPGIEILVPKDAVMTDNSIAAVVCDTTEPQVKQKGSEP